jgi:hypothetical protein
MAMKHRARNLESRWEPEHLAGQHQTFPNNWTRQRGMRAQRAAEHSIHQKIVGRARRLPNGIGNRERLPYKLSDQKKGQIA